MATDHIRVYIDVWADTTAAPSESAWQNLFQQARTKPLAQAVVQAVHAAQNDITARKRSLNVTYLRRHTLLGFEVDRDDVDDIVDVVNEQAALRGITGTNKQQFLGVLQAELRESAVDLGYSQAQADKISLSWAGYGSRENAISEAQAFLVTYGPSIWWNGG